MTRAVGLTRCVAWLALAACGKRRDKRSEVVECSAISLDARATTRGLVRLYHGAVAAATRTAAARQRELDSLKTWQADSAWNLGAAQHKTQLAACRRGADPLDRCLLVAGWPLSRVNSVPDSLWQAQLRQRLLRPHT